VRLFMFVRQCVNNIKTMRAFHKPIHEGSLCLVCIYHTILGSNIFRGSDSQHYHSELVKIYNTSMVAGGFYGVHSLYNKAINVCLLVPQNHSDPICIECRTTRIGLVVRHFISSLHSY